MNTDGFYVLHGYNVKGMYYIFFKLTEPWIYPLLPSLSQLSPLRYIWCLLIICLAGKLPSSAKMAAKENINKPKNTGFETCNWV